jgi:hypothetical protein
MLVRNFRLTFFSWFFFLSSTVCFAQTQSSCEPGHKFTPDDHERIVSVIAGHAADVIANINLKEINSANREELVLQGALKVEGIPTPDKNCIREVLKTSSVPVEALLREQPSLSGVLARIRSVRSFEELELVVRSELDAAAKNGQSAIAGSLAAGIQVLDAGRKTIYDSTFYENATKRFGSSDPSVIAQRMALRLAQRDLRGAIIGAIVGLRAGPEGALGGACIGGIKSSATAALELFTELLFGPEEPGR